jgi:DNA-binding IclR family transcriptional regulator
MELLAMRPRSPPELADGLGVHVRTARRILKRFESEGYVTALGGHHRYRLTTRVVAVAGQALEQSPWIRAAGARVVALQAEVGGTCHLSVPSLLSALCLVHWAGDMAASQRPQLRELVPCHCTAAGKALLAWREPWREAVLAQPLTRFTDRTMTAPDWLRRELGRTAARGYSIEDREYEADTRGVGAPVLSQTGEAVAALAVVAPVAELPAERYAEISGAVMEAAAALSGRST